MERGKNFKQRAVIKFLVKLSETSKQIFEKLNTVNGEAAMKPAMVYKWVKRCQEGRESLEDDQQSGRPVTTRNKENVKRIENALVENRCMFIRWLSKSLGINRETGRLIITEDLGMRKLYSRIVPKSLSADDKLTRVQVCKYWIQKCLDDPSFLDHVVTGDESWFYEYDMADKQANKAWLKKSEPYLKTPRRLRAKIKSMLILFFDRRGIINHEFFLTDSRSSWDQ